MPEGGVRLTSIGSLAGEGPRMCTQKEGLAEAKSSTMGTNNENNVPPICHRVEERRDSFGKGKTKGAKKGKPRKTENKSQDLATANSDGQGRTKEAGNARTKRRLEKTPHLLLDLAPRKET